MLESLGYQRKQILFNLPVRHIYERLQADDDSIKAQIARLHEAPQKMKNFFIFAKYITMFLDILYIFILQLMIILQASSPGRYPEGWV